MKIAMAQTSPVKGRFEENIEQHLRMIGRAAASGATLLLFPELSLTGYEPTIAKELAIEITDQRIDIFKSGCEKHKMIIGVGAPLHSIKGPAIGMIIFHPSASTQVYYKQYLHSDEEPWFVPGVNSTLLLSDTTLALAICYELSVDEHIHRAVNEQATAYLASVAKTANGIQHSMVRMQRVASQYSIPVLLSNCVGTCDNEYCAGGSAVIDAKGIIVAQLNERDTGLLFYDTVSGEVGWEYCN